MARTAERSGPLDRLKSEAGGLAGALTDRALSSARDKVGDVTDRLTEYAENGGGPGLTAAVTGAKDLAEGKSPARALLGAGTEGLKGLLGGKGKGGGTRKLKVTNIIESIDVGVPIQIAYDQWTQFSQFPSFMKKVNSVEQAQDEKVNWKAQVFWSHRTWEATILDQRPEERIIWRSKGAKGHVDGAVTFHELSPTLTRIVVVLEYHPQGLFEKTGNIWRAQGRRARLELKHFQRYVTTNTLLNPDDLEGWRGVISDSQVVPEDEAEAGTAEDKTDTDTEDQDEDRSDAQDEPDRDDNDSDEQPDDRPTRKRTTTRSSRSGQSAGNARKSTSSRRGQSARERSRKS